jgi:thiol-disulfide isomerase/thioredoxin
MNFSVRHAQRAILFLAAFSLFILPACNSTSSTATGKAGKTSVAPEKAASGSAVSSDPTAVPPEMDDAELTSLDGATFKMSDFRGKVVVINLWATWCTFCKKEMPDLVQLNEEFKDRGVEFIGLNVDNEKLPEVEKFVNDYQVTYRIGWTNEDVYDVLSPKGIPSTYIITRDGRFHWAVNGAASKERIRTKIEEAVNLEG